MATAIASAHVPDVDQWTCGTDLNFPIALRYPSAILHWNKVTAGVDLTSDIHCPTLRGEGGPPYRFAIHLRVVEEPLKEIVRKGTLIVPGLRRDILDLAFPQRTLPDSRASDKVSSDCVEHAEEVTLSGKIAYRFTIGVEGYNTDWILMALSAKQSLIIEAPWIGPTITPDPSPTEMPVLQGVLENMAFSESRTR
ncbi:MAG: hypothetical protein NVS3B20_19410 [Polyangiales bacterium]